MMILHIVYSLTILSALILVTMIAFRYWEIKVGRIRVEDGVSELGFLRFLHSVHRHLAHRSAHHGSRFARFAQMSAIKLIRKIITHHRVKAIIDSVSGKHDIDMDKSSGTTSEYFRDIIKHKDEIRKEQRATIK